MVQRLHWLTPWANKRPSRAPVIWHQIDMAPAAPAGEWCNGNTAVFGTVVLGSSPSSPANVLPSERNARSVGWACVAAVERFLHPDDVDPAAVLEAETLTDAAVFEAE